ncbi:LLM class flavin-dependent oxidoreductase [Streptomyces sp. NPDC048179]|uniref:LLM class flavin-dependent oxidoreductase n=1 Tax=Streptomyces sp. NPDC048179 TaxID=3365506 RepID=UPI003722861D
MRYSVFLVGRSTGASDDGHVMRSLAEHTLHADRLGYDAVFLPDHHFTGYAPMSSDPFMWAAYMAGRTRNLHYGFSITNLPSHHPVRFAERVNLLEQLTGGRILVGIGSGTTPEETIGFGVDFQDAAGLMEPQVETALKLWAKQPEDAPVSFGHGPYKGTLVQRLVPAGTSGSPRLMSVALRESSTARAAKYAWPAFIPNFVPPLPDGNGPSAGFTRLFEAYRTALTAHGHPQQAVEEALSWTTHTYQCVHIADSDEQAREELETILAAHQEAMDRELPFNKTAEAVSGVELKDPPRVTSEDWIRTWCLYGSPETVAAELQGYADLGVGNILMGFTTGPLTPERYALSERSLELFAREVKPLVKSPSHTTGNAR